MKRPRDSKQPTAVTARKLLDAKPFVNSAMTLERLGDGGAVASVPVRRPAYLVPPLSWVLPFSPSRRVRLDAPGAEVLDLCDGKRTIEAIIEKFAADHKLSFRESQLAVTAFLRNLVDRGLVAIVGLLDDETNLANKDVG